MKCFEYCYPTSLESIQSQSSCHQYFPFHCRSNYYQNRFHCRYPYEYCYSFHVHFHCLMVPLLHWDLLVFMFRFLIYFLGGGFTFPVFSLRPSFSFVWNLVRYFRCEIIFALKLHLRDQSFFLFIGPLILSKNNSSKLFDDVACVWCSIFSIFQQLGTH